MPFHFLKLLYFFLYRFISISSIVSPFVFFACSKTILWIKAFCPIVILLHMFFRQIFQWFVIFSSVPSNVFLINSIKSAIYWKWKILFNKTASMTKITTFQFRFLISFNRINHRFFWDHLRTSFVTIRWDSIGWVPFHFMSVALKSRTWAS